MTNNGRVYTARFGGGRTNGHAPQHHRLRYDRLDAQGRMSLRRAT